jgi:putative ABC transport system ATP-binding protein
LISSTAPVKENHVIEVRDIAKIYKVGAEDVFALHGVSFNIDQGEFVAIMGASGSGKSTLMNIFGCLDYPTSGDYFLDGIHINTLDRNGLAQIRSQKIGFVFQGFNLLARTTALENVILPLLYDRSVKDTDPNLRAIKALKELGLQDRMYHVPSQLSGGQQQRVAIARALVNDPAIILADEPTGNLDSRTSIEVITVFQQLNQKGITIILVTHEPDIAAFAKRIIELKDGVVIRDELQTPVTEVAR